MQNDTDSLDTFIYDVQTDWHARLVPSCKHAGWMREGFYTIGCDYYLARYVTWPWYREATSIQEAYEPYFNLWLRGAELRCESPTNVAVFVGRAERAP